MELVTNTGRKTRLLDEVDLITGGSGGSFTALAYGLYGDQLFDEYQARFLKRDVQGELTSRILNPVSRAAASSSAVPVALSPITINNYGGSCGYQQPPWLRAFADLPEPPRPAARALNRLHELQELDNGVEDPYFHLVDGGVSDNLGLRGVLDILETYEAMQDAGQPTPLDGTRSIIIFVVNSLSTPSTEWNKSETPPGSIDVLIKSAGVPIDRYSGEMVEQLRDIDARWRTLRRIRGSLSPAEDKNPAMAQIVNVPKADIYVVDVSFQALQNKSERDYLNQLPTSFALPDEAVDRLRAAARSLILTSPDLQQALREALRDQRARLVERPEMGKVTESSGVSTPADVTETR
jgi:NTE family protein